MSGFQDVRDVMDIQGAAVDGIPRPPAKKQKTVERRPDGITRELFALLGENPPPVAIVENKFKERPKWMGKAHPWLWKSFENPVRDDGLVLHHWERKSEPVEDISYQFAKFNVKVEVPTYTDGEYEVLKDQDWPREETDYLFSMCRDHDLRFPIIWDRYEFPGGKQRSLEDLKARFYLCCRSLMELRTPMNQMTPEETITFNLMNFDKDREIARKRMAERQFNRTPEVCKEEEMLLTELKRIVANQERMADERRDLFQRLNFPATTGTIAAYTGSQGLAHLRDMMLQTSDKNKKRKSIAMTQSGGGDTPQSGGPNSAGALGSASRDGQQKQKQVRKLSEEEESVYGVSTHEKLSSGVKLRSTMVSSTVKGASQQKITQALTQLGIATRLPMPTIKTVQRFEQLQGQVGGLIEVKKLLEKAEQEARVLESQIKQMSEP